LGAKVIVIAGPTCSGKTKLSLMLAERLNSEIISADSRQIYKYLNIGTAKPSRAELQSIKHHFIDILTPDEEYNVSRFEIEALSVINNMIKNDKVPIVAGGSGLYIKALVDGIFNTVDVDEVFRSELLELKKKFGDEYLYSELKKVDPQSASKMLPQNWKRIIRALEVFHLSGKTIGELQKEYKREINLEFIQYGLRWDRDALYSNIEARVDGMIEEGLVDETKEILHKGYSKNINSLNTVGYKEIISFIENEISLERAVELIKRNTRRFAKRQITWFKQDNRITWFDVKSQKDLGLIADIIIRKEGLNEK
jgi:tRNA dimethylallyltransferase